MSAGASSSGANRRAPSKRQASGAFTSVFFYVETVIADTTVGDASRQAILAQLECPICLTQIVAAPVFQCVNGHPVCIKCQPKLNACGVCRVIGRREHFLSFTFILAATSRCLFAEKVLAELVITCAHAAAGCTTAVSNIEAKKDHEKTCDYRFVVRLFLTSYVSSP